LNCHCNILSISRYLLLLTLIILIALIIHNGEEICAEEWIECQYKGGYQESDAVEGVTVSGDFAYLADGPNGLIILDISNQSNPKMVGHYKHKSGYAEGGITVSDNYIYIAYGSEGLLIIDITNKSTPKMIGSCDTSGHAKDVFLSDNYIYLADWDNGLVIIDVTNKTDPKKSTLRVQFEPSGSLT